MLHLFRRREAGGSNGATPGSALASHILAKLLRRLQAKDRPYLLDLGRLSGSNIEFFARARCKVQVDDLLRSAAEVAVHAPEGGPDPTPVPSPESVPHLQSASDAPLGRPERAAAPGAGARADTAPAGLRATDGRIGTALPGAPARPGQRPSRRIVLPPRTFPRGGTGAGLAGAADGPGAGLSGPAAARRRADAAPTPPLPLTIPYPDESFDAIVAWDVFNYYESGPLRSIAGEVGRVLKPGGLLLTYFHARQAQAPEVPHRFRILDEKRVACEAGPGDPLRRHLYQNRDIEKAFAGLTIVELYFLKNSMREMLLEKKAAVALERRPATRPAPSKPPRFSIE